MKFWWGNFSKFTADRSPAELKDPNRAKIQRYDTLTHSSHLFRQENTKSELPAAGMKLIHSGKVLKDDEKIENCNIKPNDFLVVIIAKVSTKWDLGPQAEDDEERSQI